MKTSAISTFCLIMILATQGAAQGNIRGQLTDTKKQSKFSAEWRLKLSGSDSKDEQSQSKIVDIRAELKTKYLLSDSLQLDIQPTVRLQSGQTQSIDGADKPENKISLNQVAAHFLPASSFRLSAGALNQRYLHTQLLVDNLAFPAARAEGLMKVGNFKTTVAAETAIPTSTSLSTNTKELEPTPSFNSASVKFQWQGSQNIYLKTSAGYFAYNNLPSSVAQQSGLLGNEVLKASEAQYQFLHKYEGIEASAEAQLPLLSNVNIAIGGEYLNNQKASTNQNQAFRYFANTEINLTKNIDLKFGGSYFAIAPEAAVSYFNSAGFQTNRIGYSSEALMAFNKEGFQVGMQYTDSAVMYANDSQSREKTLIIKLETFYVSL